MGFFVENDGIREMEIRMTEFVVLDTSRTFPAGIRFPRLSAMNVACQSQSQGEVPAPLGSGEQQGMPQAMLHYGSAQLSA